jgi:hypothetical protein
MKAARRTAEILFGASLLPREARRRDRPRKHWRRVETVMRRSIVVALRPAGYIHWSAEGQETDRKTPHLRSVLVSQHKKPQ